MLSQDLNRLILKLAPKYTVSDYAPSTFEALQRQSASGLVVWSGASDNTIYGSNIVNHAFRAWHDSLHLKLQADFTLEGEIRVATEQARILNADNLGRIILAEVQDQALYLAKHGSFPINQLEFMIQYLSKGVI